MVRPPELRSVAGREEAGEAVRLDFERASPPVRVRVGLGFRVGGSTTFACGTSPGAWFPVGGRAEVSVELCDQIQGGVGFSCFGSWFH